MFSGSYFFLSADYCFFSSAELRQNANGRSAPIDAPYKFRLSSADYKFSSADDLVVSSFLPDDFGYIFVDECGDYP